MAAESEQDPLIRSIDHILAAWRQGDCALGEHWFVHRLDKSIAVTDAGRVAAEAGADLAEQEVPGFVVVTQTCDVVRSCAERPFVEICPLVEVDDDRLREIQRGRRPAYAFVVLLSARRLVADLDRVMTVEKPLVATWERTPGWSTDAEARAFALALSRKRVRFAFPDDFTALARKLQSRMANKHEKNTDEGHGLRALREIRVLASPSWDAPQVDIFFWFVRNESDADAEGKNWADLLKEWLKLVPTTGRFKSIEGQVLTLPDMNAGEYVDSDPLDLDHLSAGLSSNDGCPQA
ncbi:hypothetical protein E4Q23_16055 [Candidatus Accumulibacter phosphatis]|uniref:Uncharacterized protein n=1 Tax=Candidatus Accumulibacter phosphatis TaxID=327160 RepID=A0ABX1U1D9_9PROT|nr:hypothetical protein [Candidatus Accumulibacter phosphatis]